MTWSSLRPLPEAAFGWHEAQSGNQVGINGGEVDSASSFPGAAGPIRWRKRFKATSRKVRKRPFSWAHSMNTLRNKTDLSAVGSENCIAGRTIYVVRTICKTGGN